MQFDFELRQNLTQLTILNPELSAMMVSSLSILLMAPEILIAAIWSSHGGKILIVIFRVVLKNKCRREDGP